MIKNVQLKIILLFSILGIFLITAMAAVSIFYLQNIDLSSIVQTEEQLQQIIFKTNRKY